ncbi:hypothetical protein [Aureliella helgolandensis]|nr:hypothetical protein [Aureliella helgolandensis]
MPATCLQAFQVGLFGRAEPDLVATYVFNGRDEATFRADLQRQGAVQLQRLQTVVELTDQQTQKLELAIKGDVTRFFRDVGEVREQTQGVNQNDQAAMQQVWQWVMPLRERSMRGLIDEDSLYQRMLETTLNESQWALYVAYRERRRTAEAHAIILYTVSELDRLLPLMHKQRQALVELLLEQPFPRKFRPEQKAYVGFLVLGRVDSTRFEQVLDQNQSKAVERIVAGYKNFAGGLKW